MIESGIDCSILAQVSFWDGLVVAAADAANCDVILTEDMNHGQVIRGVTIKNPFKKK